MSPSWRRRAVLMASTTIIWLGSIVAPSTAIADVGTADPFIDGLAEAADTPTLHWTDCQDGFDCATATVPLNYHRPDDAQIDLALIKLPAADPSKRIGTLFVNFGGPGQSGVDRLRQRGRWPWLFSDELRSRFDLVSWDQRGVSRSAGVRCFPDATEQSRILGASPGLPVDTQGEQELFAWSREFADRCANVAGRILDHASTANSARDLDLLRRAVGDATLNYHGLSYGTQLGAVYLNLFPARVRAMVLDGSIDFEGNVNGHGTEGATEPLNTRQDVPRRHGGNVRTVPAGLYRRRRALCVLSWRCHGQMDGAGRKCPGCTDFGGRSPLDLP